MSEERVAYRVRKTVYEMLRDRGYNIAEALIEETYEQFEQRDGALKMQNFLAYRPVESSEVADPEQPQLSEPIYIVFENQKDKITGDDIKRLVAFMGNHKKDTDDQNNLVNYLRKCIIVVKNGSTAIGRKALESFAPYEFEVFIQEELLVNITHHHLVPEHRVISQVEKDELLRRYRCKESQLPKI